MQVTPRYKENIHAGMLVSYNPRELLWLKVYLKLTTNPVEASNRNPELYFWMVLAVCIISNVKIPSITEIGFSSNQIFFGN